MYFGPPPSGIGTLPAAGQSQSPRTYIQNEFTGGWELDEASGGAPKREVDYSYYFSPAHRAIRAAEARKIGEHAGESILSQAMPGAFSSLKNIPGVNLDALPKIPTYEEVMAAYDAERVDLPPVSGPFPTIRNEYFRMQPGVYLGQFEDYPHHRWGDQLQYLDPVFPSMLTGYSRGSWKKADDSPAIRRLASTPNLYNAFRGRGQGQQLTYWKRAINEALANPNKGPGPLQTSLGIGGRVYAQNRALLELPARKGIFGIPTPVTGILQAALTGAGAGAIAGTLNPVVAGTVAPVAGAGGVAGVTPAALAGTSLPQTALTALNAANIAATTGTTDLSNPYTDIGPLATLASAALPGGRFIAPLVGAATGAVSGGAQGAVFGGLRGLGAAYTAGEFAAPSATTPSLFIPTAAGTTYAGLGPLGTAANYLGSPGGQFLTTIGESLATPTPTPQTIGALAPAALTTALTAGAALTPSASNVPYTYEPSYTGKVLGPSFMNQFERAKLGIAAPSSGIFKPSIIRSLDPNFMSQVELGLT